MTHCHRLIQFGFAQQCCQLHPPAPLIPHPELQQGKALARSSSKELSNHYNHLLYFREHLQQGLRSKTGSLPTTENLHFQQESPGCRESVTPQTQDNSPGLMFAHNSQTILYSNLLPGMELCTPTHVVLFSLFCLSLTFSGSFSKYSVLTLFPSPTPNPTDNFSRI